MTKSKSLFAALALPLLAAGNSASGQTFLFDFGPSTPSGAGWNNVPIAVSTSPTGQLLDFISSDGTASIADLLMIARFNGENLNGTPASTVFPTAATNSSMFGNTELFGGFTDVFPEFKLSSLDSTKRYDFTFYASRTGVTVGEVRTTDYTVTGAATGVTTLDVANNINNVATLNGVAPDAFGEIRIRLTPAASNTNANHFTYLGAMQVVTVPEPLAGSGLALGLVALAVRRRRS